MDEPIFDPDGRPVEPVTFKPEMLKHKSISLFGPSKSGKTVLIKKFLDLLRDEVDQVLVVAPTEDMNRSYEGLIPSQLIHSSMTAPDPKNLSKRLQGSKGAEAFLRNIIDRQTVLVRYWKNANDLKLLERLFSHVSNSYRREGTKEIARIQATYESSLKDLEGKCPRGSDKYEDLAEKLQEKLDEYRASVYKKYIRLDRERLNDIYKNRGHSEEERMALQYLDCNPNLILVFDDCAADLKPLFTKSTEYKNLFFRGRHYQLTLIFSFQDDVQLPTDCRKNSFISIFCNEQVASANFTRGANAFPKTIKQAAAQIVPQVFKVKYRQLVYFREDPPNPDSQFYTLKVQQKRYKPFCSPAVRELCAAMAASTTRVDSNNPYFRRFAGRP